MSAPASANPIATACPMPLVAPVITAVEPSSEKMDAIVVFFVYPENQTVKKELIQKMPKAERLVFE